MNEKIFDSIQKSIKPIDKFSKVGKNLDKFQPIVSKNFNYSKAIKMINLANSKILIKSNSHDSVYSSNKKSRNESVIQIRKSSIGNSYMNDSMILLNSSFNSVNKKEFNINTTLMILKQMSQPKNRIKLVKKKDFSNEDFINSTSYKVQQQQKILEIKQKSQIKNILNLNPNLNMVQSRSPCYSFNPIKTSNELKKNNLSSYNQYMNSKPPKKHINSESFIDYTSKNHTVIKKYKEATFITESKLSKSIKGKSKDNYSIENRKSSVKTKIDVNKKIKGTQFPKIHSTIIYSFKTEIPPIGVYNPNYNAVHFNNKIKGKINNYYNNSY